MATPAGNSNASGMDYTGTLGSQQAGRRSTRRGPTAKALKRVLKGHGLKTSGKKATLRARAKKAQLLSKA